MKNKIFATLIAIMLVMTSVPVLGADVTGTVDTDTDYLTVSGTIDDAAGKRITIQVLNPHMTEEDCISVTPQTFTDVFCGFGEVYADAKGRFEYQCQLGDISGFYSIRIRPQGMDTVYMEKSVKYITDSFEEDFLKSFSEADLDGKVELMKNNVEILGLDFEAFEELEETPLNNEKATVVKLIGNDFESLSDFVYKYELSFLTNLLNKSEDGAFLALMDDYRDKLEGICSVFPIYDEYISDNGKANIDKKLCSQGFETVSEMAQTLGDSIVLEAVASLGNKSRLEALLKMSKEWLDCDFVDYFKLDDKSPVNRAIAGKRFDSTKKLCDEIKSETKDAKKKESSGSSSSSSSGSSSVSSGSGYSSVSLPTITPNNEDKDDDAPITDVSSNKMLPFDDLSDVLWAQESISYLYEKGVINGITKDKFEPSRNITRAEFVKILVEAFFGVDATATESFDDVASSDWYAPYVATAVKLGIANGVSASAFAPSIPITRQDMAVMVANCAKAASVDLPSANPALFADNGEISDYAKISVYKLYANSIISGYPDGTFVPKGNATRAQCAKLVCDLMKRVGGA